MMVCCVAMTNIIVIAQLDWAIQLCFFLDAGSSPA